MEQGRLQGWGASFEQFTVDDFQTNVSLHRHLFCRAICTGVPVAIGRVDRLLSHNPCICRFRWLYYTLSTFFLTWLTWFTDIRLLTGVVLCFYSWLTILISDRELHLFDLRGLLHTPWSAPPITIPSFQRWRQPRFESGNSHLMVHHCWLAGGLRHRIVTICPVSSQILTVFELHLVTACDVGRSDNVRLWVVTAVQCWARELISHLAGLSWQIRPCFWARHHHPVWWCILPMTDMLDVASLQPLLLMSWPGFVHWYRRVSHPDEVI